MFYSDPIASAFADYEERKKSFQSYFKGWKILLTKVKEDALCSNVVLCNQEKDSDWSIKAASFSEGIKNVVP